MSLYGKLYMYSFDCATCGKKVHFSRNPKKCVTCEIELCKKCYNENEHMCIWCYNKSPNEYLWIHKFIDILTYVFPLILLLLPTPLSMFLVLFPNLNMGFWLTFLFCNLISFIFPPVFILLIMIILSNGLLTVLVFYSLLAALILGIIRRHFSNEMREKVSIKLNAKKTIKSLKSQL